MNNKTNPLLVGSMTYGLYLGIVLVIFSLLIYLFNIKPIGIITPIIMFIVSTAITFMGIFWATKKIKIDVLDGSLSYGQGLLIGVLVVFFAAILSAVYSYIQSTIIDPDYMKNIMEAQKEWMYQYMSGKGVPEVQIEKAMEGIDAKMQDINPIKNIFSSILSSTIFGFIISLITAAILKKKNDNPFEPSQVAE